MWQPGDAKLVLQNGWFLILLPLVITADVPKEPPLTAKKKSGIAQKGWGRSWEGWCLGDHAGHTMTSSPTSLSSEAKQTTTLILLRQIQEEKLVGSYE